MSVEEQDRSYWDRHAHNYDRSMLLLGRPMTRMVELTAEAVRGAEHVLEVAAGTGLVTLALGREAERVLATDYSERMVALLQQKVAAAGLSNVQCAQADVYAMGFPSHTFDAVVGANVLHLVPDIVGALVALRSMLKPGGRLIVPTFCHDETAISWAVSRVLAITGFPGHRRFTSRNLREVVEGAGLHVTRMEIIPGVIPVCYLEGAFEVMSGSV